MNGRKPLFVLLVVFGAGADLGCVQSGNWLGAALWSGVVAVCAWLAVRSTYA